MFQQLFVLLLVMDVAKEANGVIILQPPLNISSTIADTENFFVRNRPAWNTTVFFLPKILAGYITVTRFKVFNVQQSKLT